MHASLYRAPSTSASASALLQWQPSQGTQSGRKQHTFPVHAGVVLDLCLTNTVRGSLSNLPLPSGRPRFPAFSALSKGLFGCFFSLLLSLSRSIWSKRKVRHVVVRRCEAGSLKWTWNPQELSYVYTFVWLKRRRRRGRYRKTFLLGIKTKAKQNKTFKI